MTERDFDDLIAEALNEDERQFLADLEEPTMMQQGLDLFRGRNRAMHLFIGFVTTIFLVLGVYCLYRFLGTTETASMLRWGAGLFYCFGMVFGIKLWGWMEMQSNSMRREIKRVELQLLSLTHRLEGEGGG